MTPTLSIPVSVAATAPLPPAPLPRPFVVNGSLRIPPIGDLNAFRQWLHSDEFPEKLRVSYLAGVVWLDLSMEQLISHNRVKGAVGAVLWNLTEADNVGCYCVDGMRLSHPAVDLSTEPDGMFIFYNSLQSGQIGRAGRQGTTEFVGTPDMVLEVVSETSVEKDTVTLPPLYLAMGVREFWRIDARGDLEFQILRHAPTGYTPTQLPDGWWRSDVFQRDFRMTTHADPLGDAAFVLQHR